MYTRDHGRQYVKSLTLGARKIYKRAFSKTRRNDDKREWEDKHAEPRCPLCGDPYCGGWCG